MKRENFKRGSDNGMYEIQYDIADIFEIMFKNFKGSPFYKKRKGLEKKTIEDINKYNDIIIQEIDQLPDYLQFYIKCDENYEFNLWLSELMPMIIDRLTVLFKSILTKSDRDVGSKFGTLIEHIDAMIDEYCKEDLLSKWREENLKPKIKEIKKNKESEKIYNMDYILKDAFDQFYRKEFSKFDEKIISSDLLQQLTINNSDDINKLRGLYRNKLSISVNEKVFNDINNNIRILKENVKQMKSLYRIPSIDKRYGNVSNQKRIIEEDLKFLYSNYEESGKILKGRYHIALNPFILKISEEIEIFKEELIKRFRNNEIKEGGFFYGADDMDKLPNIIEKIYNEYRYCKDIRIPDERMKNEIIKMFKEIGKYKEELIEKYSKEIIKIEDESYIQRCKLFDKIDKDYGYEIKTTFNIAFGQMLINIMNKEKIK